SMGRCRITAGDILDPALSWTDCVESRSFGLFFIASNDVLTRPPTPSLRQKIHRHAIDAIAQMRWRRAIGKDIAEMTAAAAARQLDAPPPESPLWSDP